MDLEKIKLHKNNKEKGQDVNAFWNFIKHSNRTLYNEVIAADLVGVNFHLLFNACQDFLRVFSIVNIDGEFNIEKLKKFSLGYSYIIKEEEPKLYAQLEEREQNKYFFDYLKKFHEKRKNDMEILNFAMLY